MCVVETQAFAWLTMMMIKAASPHPVLLQNQSDEYVCLSETAANTWKWAAVDVDVADVIINVFYIPPNQEPIPRGVFKEDVHLMARRQNARVTSQGKLLNEQWASQATLVPEFNLQVI